MSSTELLAPRILLPPFRPTLDTYSPAQRIAESRHVADMAAIFTVCLCTANAGRGAAHFFLGEFITARALLEQGLAEPTQRVIKGLALDPYATGLTFLAWTLAYLGYIDQARSRMDEAVLEAS